MDQYQKVIGQRKHRFSNHIPRKDKQYNFILMALSLVIKNPILPLSRIE